MDVLSSRTLIRAVDVAVSRRFYRDTLGLAVYRQFGDPANPSTVFFAGGGYVEVTGGGTPAEPGSVCIWLQVRDVAVEHARLAELGVTIVRPPRLEPWGLNEMWIADPDGIQLVLVDVPPDHPIRRDPRPFTPADT